MDQPPPTAEQAEVLARQFLSSLTAERNPRAENELSRVQYVLGALLTDNIDIVAVDELLLVCKWIQTDHVTDLMAFVRIVLDCARRCSQEQGTTPLIYSFHDLVTFWALTAGRAASEALPANRAFAKCISTCLKEAAQSPLVQQAAREYLDRLQGEEWSEFVNGLLGSIKKASLRVLREPVVQQVIINIFLARFGLRTRAILSNNLPHEAQIEFRSLDQETRTSPNNSVSRK